MVLVLANACLNPETSGQPSKLDAKGLVIRYLTAPKQVIPSRGAEILCVATDAGGGTIAYAWAATGGQIQNREEPESILWIAPSKEGSYTIRSSNTEAIEENEEEGPDSSGA